MNPSGYVKVTMSVLMAAIVVISVLVPVVYGASMTTVTITNEGAGWAKFAYNDEATDYNIAMSAYGSNLTLGDQTGAADEMIVYASDVFSILYADDSFKLVAPSGASADLGSSAAVASSSGTVTVTDANSTPVYGTDAVTWSYVPDVDGSFGFFTETGKTVKDFPVAAAGSFAGAYAYNEINSLNLATFAPTYSVTDGVFNTGNWANADLSKAVKVVRTLPDEEKKIDDSTLVKDVVVKSVINPSTGTQIDDLYYSFSGNEAAVVGISSALSSATSIVIPDTVTSGGTTYNVTSISPGTSSSNGVFAGLTSLETVTLPSNLISIGKYAFYGCTNLALTSLPDGVTSIGGSAFRNCTNLALTSLPDGVTSIGVSAFYGCTNLALTSLPDGVTSIGGNAFYDCTNLALTSLPDGVTSIEDNAFYDCTNLALTSLPDGVTSIGVNAFVRCTNLALTSLPDGVTSIGSGAFANCTNLTGSLIIPDGVTSIGGSAFAGCTGYGGLIVLGSPSFGAQSLGMSNVAQVLNLGTTALNPGDYGLPSTATVDDEIPSLGYIAPASFSETVQNTGLVYTIMSYLPVLIIVGLMVGVLGVFVSNRRA